MTNPIIISASRATDIPAFFASEFMDSLRKGNTTWINPFNHKPYHISFANTRLIVFWTKNPNPIIPFLDEINKMGINYYFQYTLNDYEHEGLERYLPALHERIESFIKLSEIIGREKVIWRFDPLILTDTTTIPVLLDRIQNIGGQLLNHTNKLVFSFVDVMKYRKVKNKLIHFSDCFTMENIESAEFTNTQKLEFAYGLSQIHKKWKKANHGFEISTCAEDINLNEFEISHNKCIDDNLMLNLFSNDKALMDFLSPKSQFNRNLKDKGQRKECLCIVSKDIGAYNTCKYSCLYCYATGF